jgi:hypothetical protein
MDDTNPYSDLFFCYAADFTWLNWTTKPVPVHWGPAVWQLVAFCVRQGDGLA